MNNQESALANEALKLVDLATGLLTKHNDATQAELALLHKAKDNLLILTCRKGLKQ